MRAQAFESFHNGGIPAPQSPVADAMSSARALKARPGASACRAAATRARRPSPSAADRMERAAGSERIRRMAQGD